METQAELHLLHHAYLEPAVPSLLGTVSYMLEGEHSLTLTVLAAHLRRQAVRVKQ